jgi:hypothetical protein
LIDAIHAIQAAATALMAAGEVVVAKQQELNQSIAGKNTALAILAERKLAAKQMIDQL